jgi:hypothetical protein
MIAPLEVYLHALKGNENIIHISFDDFHDFHDFDLNRFLCDLPLARVTSTSQILIKDSTIPDIHRDRDPLFVKSHDLNKFADKIRPELLDDSTYIFTDTHCHTHGFDIEAIGGFDIGIDSSRGKLGGSARVLISFVAPTSDKCIILRLKHSGKEDSDAPLEVTLGSSKIQLNPSSKSSITIDDITLYPIEVSGPFESDQLSFEPEIRNDIFIKFGGELAYWGHDHLLHDIELLGEGDQERFFSTSSSLVSELFNW